MNARGERILIFGDSLTHPGQDSNPAIQMIVQGSNRATSAPGDLLGSLLLEQGAVAVQTDAKVGRSALSFWQAEPSAQLVAADQAFAPTKVIVMLGTNDASRDPVATETAMAQLRDTYKGMGAEVWAVGPMAYVGSGASLNAPADAIFGAMQRVFGKAQTIDARPFSAGLTQLGVDRAGDGIHFTPSGAAQLAPQIASALLTAKPASVWPKIALITGGGLALGAIVWMLGQRVRSPAPALPEGAVAGLLAAPRKKEAIPLPFERKPQIPSRWHDCYGKERVPLDRMIATQREVTTKGVRDYRAHQPAHDIDLPVVYRTDDGRLYIADGHHRIVAALKRGEHDIKARVIDIGDPDHPRAPSCSLVTHKKLEGLGELPAEILKKWKRGIAAYNKAVADTAAGDREAFGRAVTARGKLDKIIDQAAAYMPGSYKDPVIDALHAEKAALPKIADAEEQGRIARGKQYDEERKKLVAEQREVDREYDWMKR